MKKKVSYIALIICTLAVALFWNNDIARTLLSFELLLVPCLFILSVYLERNLSASLVVPDRYVPKGEKFEVDVHVSNASVLPMSTVPVTLLCHSRLSSRESAYTRDAFVTPGSGSSLFNIGKVAVKDYLSLFTRECSVSEHSSSVFVLPRIHMLDMARVLGLSESVDGELFSKLRHGEDSSEVFDIRQYRRGDLLHSFHWKLSAKTNDLMVKEYSLPMNETLPICHIKAPAMNVSV